MVNFISKVKRRFVWVLQYSARWIIKKSAKPYLEDAFVSTYHVVPFTLRNRLKIASTAIVANAFFNTASGSITLEDYVTFGPNVSVITGTHDFNKFGRERQITGPKKGRDIVIKRGVFVGCNVTILGPCIIGENAVIGACCLVHSDVPANTICYSNNTLILKPKLHK